MEKIKEMIKKAWEGELNPAEVIKEIKIKNPAVYLAAAPIYSVFYFKYRGRVYALPGFGPDGEHWDFPPNARVFSHKEEAKEFALFGKEPGEGEIVERVVIEKIENLWGEEIPVVELIITRHQNEYFLEETQLNCRASYDYGLGNCACVSHPTYVTYILKKLDKKQIQKLNI